MTQLKRPWLIAIMAGLIAIWLISAVVLRQPAAPEKKPVKKPDFSAFTDVKAKKAAFFNYLLPATESKNAKILEQREKMLSILAKPADARKRADKRFLAELAVRYGVIESEQEAPLDDEQTAQLKRRVDIVPPSMTLAQAASESGWGTSRFARLGNNFFGEWCYTKGCGLLPSRRPEGATHEVRKFDSVNESIAAYYDNINTHYAYQDLRIIRAQLREEGKAVTGLALTPGLLQYSERREAYVEDIQLLIRSNKLSAYDRDMNERAVQ
ncbi:MAG TPA: glucosaminidase domain-containing protein [Marinagarivorans sp.]